MSYKGGVFTGCTSNGSTDHAVTAIGWDSGGNWIVKNSWDVNWGEGGHVRFQNGNMCHICEYLINAL
jgi:C1A family cysteine protease